VILRSLHWRIALPYAVLALLSALALGAILARLVYFTQLSQLETRAAAQARFVADQLQAPVDAGAGPAELQQSLANAAANQSEARFVLLSPQGGLLADSRPETPLPPLQLPGADYQAVLASGQASRVLAAGSRTAATLVAAVRIQSGGVPAAILQSEHSLAALEQTGRLIGQASLAAGAVLALLAVIVAIIIAELTTRPLRNLASSAELPAPPSLPAWRDEIGRLVLAFNSLAGQLRAQIEALRSERGKLAAVLQQMNDGVLIVDAQGRVQLINRAAERLFSIREQEALGRTLAETLREHRLVELWRLCQETGQEQALSLETYRPSLFLQCIVTPLEEISPGGALIIFQDLTRLRRLETVRRDFISNISHELRTPLASLKVLTETLQDGALEDPPAARRFLDSIEIEVDTLVHLVSELLELARIESGKVPLVLKTARPEELLAQSSERLGLQAERGRLELRLECPPGLPPVLADAGRMQQVLVNLLHNAIKFTPPGGSISLSARAVSGQVEFTVQDTGVGIPAEDLPRIFERFYKADRARHGGGTGLGLAIARHLVEAHGGRIWAESTQGQGSAFRFTLPTVEEIADPGQAAAHER
jgi:two-component system phosphate regulon sensor histidine kinase PhoR